MNKKSKFLSEILALGLLVSACVNKEHNKVPKLENKDAICVSVESSSQPIESLVSSYKQRAADPNMDSAKVVSVFKWFLEVHDQSGKFAGLNPCRIQPIYAYGISGVAYYEIWFKDTQGAFKGWVLLSATDNDYPVINYSYGTPYSARLLKNESNEYKVFRFGPSYFTLEQNGSKIAEYGQMPAYIVNSSSDKKGSGSFDSKAPQQNDQKRMDNPKEGVDYFMVYDYEHLKTLLPKYYYSEQRRADAKKDQMAQKSKISASNLRTEATYNEIYAYGSYGHHTQIPANEGVNTTGCFSGCNNNAWLNVFVWWDWYGGKPNLIPTTTDGNDSPTTRNTMSARAVADPIQMYCNSVCGTYCGGTTGYTYYWNAYKGYQYAVSRGYAYSYAYRWNIMSDAGIVNIALDGISNSHCPVMVGTANHVYLAYGWKQEVGYNENTWVLCYPGWRDDNVDNLWLHWRDLRYGCKFLAY